MGEHGKSIAGRLKPFHLIFLIAGIGNFRKPTILNKLYIYFLVLFDIICIIYYCTVCTLSQSIILVVYMSLTFTFLVSTSIAIHICTTFFAKPEFIKIFEDTDKEILIPEQKWNKCYYIILVMLLDWIVVLYGGTSNLTICSFIIAVHNLICDITKLLMYWLLSALILRFEVLQSYLTDFFEWNIILESPNSIIPVIDSVNLLKTVKKVSKLHNILCDALEIMNTTFGLAVLCDVLLSLSSLIVYGTLIAFVFRKTQDVRLYISMGIWIIRYLVSIKCSIVIYL